MRGVIARTIGAALSGAVILAFGAGSVSAEDIAAAQRLAPATLEAAARRYFPSDDAKAPPTRLFRLTRSQLDATVKSLLPDISVPPVASAMARDPLQTNYEYADLLGINGANGAALSAWIADIAARVRKAPGGVIKCPGSAPTDACLTTQAQAFIVKAFRGDAAPDKIEQFSGFFLSAAKSGGLAQAAGDLVEVVLNSPNFLFRKETDIIGGQRLQPAQLLQAVTYTLGDAPPDAFQLKSEAAARYLRSGADAAATIGAILATQAARDKLQRFFKAWLEVREPGEFTISAEIFPEFTPAQSARMVGDADRFLAQVLSKPAPRLSDLTQALPAIEMDSAANDPIAAKLESLDGPRRMGILSMPAVLASHSGPTNTRPIKRGVFWARKVMCMPMEPPPKELHAKIYETPGATERQKIEQSTKRAACNGCHKVINPLGFFQESYDTIGRWRTLDNQQPIDTSVLIDFLDEAPVKTTTSVEALTALTNSLMFKQCFVRQMFRYYMGRNEEPSDDPTLRRMFLELTRDDGQDILRTLYALTSSDRIVRRQ